jgi:hypothetical protein
LKNWLDIVIDKTHIEQLHTFISQLHGCDCLYVESVPTCEVFEDKTVWRGDVEVFDLIGHSKAKRCYAWAYGEPEEFITILELPPVTDTQSAVKVAFPTKSKKEYAK